MTLGILAESSVFDNYSPVRSLVSFGAKQKLAGKKTSALLFMTLGIQAKSSLSLKVLSCPVIGVI